MSCWYLSSVMADAIRILSADSRGDEDRGEVRLERARV